MKWFMEKNPLLGRMPGDEWQRFANLRLLYSYMFTHPGAKLLFMGAEIGQYEEWNFNKVWTGIYWNMNLIKELRNYLQT